MPGNMSNEHNEKYKLLSELDALRGRVKELETQLSLTSDNVYVDLIPPQKGEQNFFRSLLNAIPDLVWIKDPDGIYLSCNEAFESFFGAKEAEIVTKTDYDFVDESLADFFRSQDKLAMQSDKPRTNEEWITIAETGERKLVETIKTPVRNEVGELIGILGIARDITDRKLAEEGLLKRVTALTRALDSSEDVDFADLFDIKDIQRLQDEFSDATGVASLITYPDGSPITQASNFCELCEIIRETDKGRENCHRSDAIFGQMRSGPTISTCMSGGLWDAGAGISVGGRHVANWLIGQVRDESQDENNIRAYAREIGADEDVVVREYRKVRAMSQEQFLRVSKVLYTLATQLSEIAYKNVQQARSINDLKRTEAELAKTRNYLSNIIDSMPSILIGVDTSCRVTQWNMEAEKVTAIPAKDVLGRTIVEVLPRMAVKMDRIEEAIRTRTPCSDSLQTDIAGCEVLHESITVYPLVSNGVDGAVIRIDDVTDIVKLQQMMIQSEKMLSVGGLAAGIAHEINNPLAGILGYALNIKRRIFGDVEKNVKAAQECGVSLDDVRKYLEYRDIPKMLDGINESGTRAATIVRNMLSFSRKSEMKLERHDVAELLNTTLELAENDYNLKIKYDFKQINIVREYEKDVPPVRCEKNEIQQVFLNILKNGAEAMMEKVYNNEQPCFICRVKYEKDNVVVEIEDNGPGIDEGIRKRIFEPFYTTKLVGHGTGLGLSVSCFIVTELHHGCMEIDSMAGEWTRFIIKLPLEEDASV